MDPFTTLSALGLGVGANAVYDYLKTTLAAPTPPSAQAFEAGLQNVINLSGVQMSAETVIEALAKQGIINIVGSNLHGAGGLTIGSQGGQSWFGDDSVATTNKTAIHAIGVGTGIRTTGNAKVVQHPDGSIRFYT